MRQTGKRNSSVELLKCLAILLIIISHAQPKYGALEAPWRLSLTMATDNPQIFGMIIGDYFGQIGNAIFIICSAWFLIESNDIKVKKILHLLTDSWIVSIIAMGGGTVIRV